MRSIRGCVRAWDGLADADVRVYFAPTSLVATGLSILLITGIALARSERRREDQYAHSFARTIDGAFRRLTFDEFRTLPQTERTYLLGIDPIRRSFEGETHRHAQKALRFYQSPGGRAVLLKRRIRRLFRRRRRPPAPE